MPRFYVEYHIRAGEHSVHRAKVVESDSFASVIASMPNRETFTLPEYYETETEDGPFKSATCHVCHTYYEWAEPVKTFMWNWSDRRIVEWYKDNLTPCRVKYIEPYEPDPDKRALKRLKNYFVFGYEIALRIGLLIVIAIVDHRAE